MADADVTWWQRGVVYQIYPRSYQDSTGDGFGDLAGIRQRLDHLAWLGVDAIWLSPITASPFEDGGYDVTDYTAIHPMFGTLADLDALVEAAHDRGLRVILDVVPNHTSHLHPWFVSSRSAREDPQRHWYVWRDPAPDGGPPTNWRSTAVADPGGAWNLDERTGQYYLATFSRVQPDLNWANPEVRGAMADVLRFWLDRGVDGFRLDMASFLGTDPDFRDEAAVPTDLVAWTTGGRHHFNRPETMAYLRELRAVVDRYDDRVLIGEMVYGAGTDVLVDYASRSGIDLPTNFGLITQPFDADAISAHVDAYDRAAVRAGVWPNYCIANHDMPRPARLGPQGARVAMLLLLTLRGTPFIYYGDEIGMANVVVPPDRADDRWPASLGSLTRDSVRTPMQWNAGPNAGFCAADVQPWLPIADDHGHVNVETQRGDPSSTLWLTRRLLALRRSSAALATGAYERLPDPPPDCVAFIRAADTDRALVVVNLGEEARDMDLPGHGGSPLLVATGAVQTQPAADRLRVGPRSGAVLQL